MKLKYGKEEIQLPIQDKNIIQILNSNKQKALLYPENRLKNLLKNPINGPSLKDLVNQKKAKKILIVVNDITRPTPYEVILPPLLDELHQIGIKKENILLMVATGIHRSNSQEEIKEIFGENIFSTYKFINHDCDDSHLKDLGKLKSGNKLWVDPIVSDIDFIITTG
ncbi:MAG: DUF2088 domain-containing protein, partial [Atribacteria sp.]|nr:DUF2088 domain-containing protein [Candidatus Atribacteria bacterium]